MEDDPVLTCICCRQTFATPQEQRSHYQSDFHRFNLKRKVVDLPPVTLELFEQKVNEIRDKKTIKEVFTGHCNYCRKNFSNERTYKAHITSKKHLEKQKIYLQKNKESPISEGTTSVVKQIKKEEIKKENEDEVKIENAEGDLTEDEIIQEKIRKAHKFEEHECLFCSKHNANFTKNVSHMTKEHGFFIPDIEYMVDLEGLIAYLGEKIGTGNVCLFCSRIFGNTEAVQNHMRSLCHAKLNYDDDDTLDELGDFYDFSKSWEAEDVVSVIGENKNSNALITVEDSRELIKATGKGILDIDDDGYTLTLGSGKRIGHRDLILFYKQNYRRFDSHDPEAVNATINKYKSLGWKTVVTEKDRRARAIQNRKFYKQQMQVSIKANSLQRHFRVQVDY